MSNPILWLYVRRFARLCFAAALLMIDWRFFALYAFLILLRAWEAIDHVRATVRVLAVLQDVRMFATMRKLDVTHDELLDVLRDVRERQDGELESIARDWSISRGRNVKLEDLFSTREVMAFSMLRRENQSPDAFGARILADRADDEPVGA